MKPLRRIPASAGIRVTIDDPGWRRLGPGVSALVARAAAQATADPLSVVLTDDRTVRRLNARYRGRDEATNVLTFEPPAAGLPGELVLALATVRREAAAAGRPARAHLVHLVVHGALHLSGHDHVEAGAARRMEMAEARLLAGLGVANPWRPRVLGGAS